MKYLKLFNELHSNSHDYSDYDVENVKRLWDDGYHDECLIARELDYTDIDEETVAEIIKILLLNNEIEYY
jgi:hypothetical protein